jgi:hypothetical protein
MKRRTLLQTIAAVLFTGPLARVGLLAQTPRAVLTDANIATLKAVSEAVLPSALGEAGRSAAVDRFVAWVRDYREGADRGHSYSSSTVSQPTGPSPAARYPSQFAALDELARTRGAMSFASLALDGRREVIQAVLDKPQRIANMPARPNGASLVADLMGYYYGSESAYDLAYDAAIGRDSCRGLDGSNLPPAPLRKG